MSPSLLPTAAPHWCLDVAPNPALVVPLMAEPSFPALVAPLMAEPPYLKMPEEPEVCVAADSEGQSAHAAAHAAPVHAATGCAAAHAADVAVVAHEVVSAAAESYVPAGTRRSIRGLHCLHIVLFVPAHTPTLGHSLVDEPRD
jgi:hypothetical protein